MSDADDFKHGLVDNLPHLRAFAHMIARDHALAEDLVQDTMMRALANRSLFNPGTNLKRWLTVILRNRFFNEMRRSGRKSEIGVDVLDDLASVDGGQEINVEVSDFKTAFSKLPAAQREALVLVGASGFSYEEAAEIAGCPVGTMKSRVSRARLDLQQKMEGVEAKSEWKGCPEFVEVQPVISSHLVTRTSTTLTPVKPARRKVKSVVSATPKGAVVIDRKA